MWGRYGDLRWGCRFQHLLGKALQVIHISLIQCLQGLTPELTGICWSCRLGGGVESGKRQRLEAGASGSIVRIARRDPLFRARRDSPPHALAPSLSLALTPRRETESPGRKGQAEPH